MRLILFSIILSFGYGKIVFIPHSINGGEKGILSLHAIDLNGDGHTDLLFSSIESNTITWLENKGNVSYNCLSEEFHYSYIDNAGHHLGYWCK